MVNDAYAPELLRSLFRYDSETGRLFHAVDRVGANKRVYARAGELADTAKRRDTAVIPALVGGRLTFALVAFDITSVCSRPKRLRVLRT